MSYYEQLERMRRQEAEKVSVTAKMKTDEENAKKVAIERTTKEHLPIVNEAAKIVEDIFRDIAEHDPEIQKYRLYHVEKIQQIDEFSGEPNTEIILKWGNKFGPTSKEEALIEKVKKNNGNLPSSHPEESIEIVLEDYYEIRADIDFNNSFIECFSHCDSYDLPLYSSFRSKKENATTKDFITNPSQLLPDIEYVLRPSADKYHNITFFRASKYHEPVDSGPYNGWVGM